MANQRLSKNNQNIGGNIYKFEEEEEQVSVSEPEVKKESDNMKSKMNLF